ncbi:MAG: GGDEF domain-containing protein [Desulfobacterales bacterium]|nr:GGDEF domain-containing protein [Desulfobacterales bacterium]
MEKFLNKMVKNTLLKMSFLINMVKTIDYKTLYHYILRIHQKKEIDSILIETSKCLKDILNYRLFAFTLKTGEDINAWVDPIINENSFTQVIKNDFHTDKGIFIHHINKNNYDRNQISFQSNQVKSFVLIDENYSARLYILPERKMLPYHDEIIEIIIETLNIALSNAIKIKNLKNEASIDPLTKCYNRREFDRIIDRDISNSQRYNKDLSIIMLDIDHFKKINDTYGHQTGDKVLTEIAKELNKQSRKGDTVARYGGEEFVIVLPEVRKSKALEVANRLRMSIEQLQIEFQSGKNINVTASFGVASLTKTHNKDSFLKEADKMLYQAKDRGRNTVMPDFKLYKAQTG